MGANLPRSVDRLDLSLRIRALGFDRRAEERARQRGVAEGIFLAGDNPAVLVARLPAEVDTSAAVSVRLAVRRIAEDGVEFYGSASTNVTRGIRLHLGAAAGPVGFAGDNVIGPMDAIPAIAELTEMQVTAVGQRLADLVARVTAGAESAEAELAIQGIEVNHDWRVPNAALGAHIIQRSSPPTAYYVETAIFSGDARGEIDRGYASTSYFTTKGGASFTPYAKLSDLMRVEGRVTRDALKSIGVGTAWAQVSGAGLLDLVREVIEWAGEPLAQIKAHSERVLSSTATPFELAAGLRPLLEAALGDRASPGRPPATSFAAKCADAYNQLMIAGRVLPAGERPGSRLRQLLDRLVAAGVLARELGRFTMYVVAPELVTGLITDPGLTRGA